MKVLSIESSWENCPKLDDNDFTQLFVQKRRNKHRLSEC